MQKYVNKFEEPKISSKKRLIPYNFNDKKQKSEKIKIGSHSLKINGKAYPIGIGSFMLFVCWLSEIKGVEDDGNEDDDDHRLVQRDNRQRQRKIRNGRPNKYT